jgi:hypothetical protein
MGWQVMRLPEEGLSHFILDPIDLVSAWLKGISSMKKDLKDKGVGVLNSKEYLTLLCPILIESL